MVAADLGVRWFVQSKIETTVTEQLPEGTTATVGADVHGFSAIWQVVTRRLDHVTLTAPDLTVGGIDPVWVPWRASMKTTAYVLGSAIVVLLGAVAAVSRIESEAIVSSVAARSTR